MVDILLSRHEVFERFRLCPLSAPDEDGDIGGEAGQASGEPRDILRDTDDVTTVRILPSLEAVDAHDGGDLGDEHHLLNFRQSLQLWGYISRVHVIVGREGFGVLLVAVTAFAPVCLQKSKMQKVKSAPHHVVLAPWRSGSVCTFESCNPLEVSSSPSACFVLFFKRNAPPPFFLSFPSFFVSSLKHEHLTTGPLGLGGHKHVTGSFGVRFLRPVCTTAKKVTFARAYRVL